MQSWHIILFVSLVHFIRSNNIQIQSKRDGDTSNNPYFIAIGDHENLIEKKRPLT